ncbi:AAA family ATPase [Rhizobium leguminosarum bv. viciae]|uniref:AAA family ATPase n=1 Tax=Rhizobium leguminosarum TaxID=384 RepID=UPI0014422658|nr:AAA family ATPase [Rhizobium leguminosarum]NKK36293.1 AAA family ATPase [Rhizobium leguminosarum bv. viciae]
MTQPEDYESKRSQAAIDRVRDLVGADRLSVADRIARLYSEYIALDRDKLLRDALVASIASVTTPITGKPDKRRIVAVCGRSGAGKTTSIVKHIQNLKAMASYFDEDGVRIHPVIFIEAPSPCTPRLLAIAGLEALGHTPPDRIRENEAWLLFRRLLKVHKVMWVVIDEAQHTIEAASVREATVIGDAFKNLTQMTDWPVRLILIGVPPLASFLARKQLYNRRTVVPFDTVDAEGNTDLIKSILNTIVLEHAGMEIRIDIEETSADDHEEEKKKQGAFLKRLMHAGDAEFGSVVQMIRAAVELAMLDGRQYVLLDDFVKTYASFSGCRPSKNVFTAANWQDLDPATALLRDEDRAWEENKLKTKGKNATKYGVRPQ